MILFINACVREESRTERLAEALLSTFDDEVTEVRLSDEEFPEVDEKFLRERDAAASAGAFDAPMFRFARQFAAADRIVTAAPYWDLSFPASLKRYIEQVSVVGLTFTYTEDGRPKGLCKADRIYYVTTVGGIGLPDDFGYGYIKALAKRYYGISETELIKAEGLDIIGADPEKILESVIEKF